MVETVTKATWHGRNCNSEGSIPNRPLGVKLDLRIIGMSSSPGEILESSLRLVPRMNPKDGTTSAGTTNDSLQFVMGENP